VSSYTWALFLHLVGAALLAGGMTVAGAAQWAALRRSRPAEIALLLSLARIGVVLVALGALVVTICGFWLIEETGSGLDEGWLGLSFALFVLGVVLGAAGGRRPKRARLLAERIAAQNEGDSAEVKRLLRDPLSLALNALAAAALLAVLLLMVWQPALG
jgi:uncharacterized membrane protein